MPLPRSIVRVRVAGDCRVNAERELTVHAIESGAGRPYRQGTAPELLWDFTGPDRLERAQMFRVAIENTPGVVAVEGP